MNDNWLGDDMHHNGAFFLPHAFNFLMFFGHPRPKPTAKFEYKFEHGTPDGYQFFLDLGPLRNAEEKYFKGDVAFWGEIMRHGTYDAFWKGRNLRPHLKEIRPAVMTVGGWFDAENLFGALETYKAVEKSSPRATNLLVMGPWLHGGWAHGAGESLGQVHFHSDTAAFYREHIELPFFEKYLKGKGDPAGDLPEAYLFETGTNQWRRYDAWPPRDARPRSLFLRAGGRLAFEAPEDESGEDFDEYVSDPARPVPYLGRIEVGMAGDYMIDDQRPAARRPDVLVYRTEPLDEDLTVVGPIRADLIVSTSGTDSDWVVKLVDVYPDDYPDPSPNQAGVRMGGFQQLVRGDVMRGKFRDGLDDPKPFRPGEPTAVAFTLQDVDHTFRRGHRLMVQVQSSWFPLVDRNPQTFVDIYAAKESDFRKATQRVYHARGRASRLEVRVRP